MKSCFQEWGVALRIFAGFGSIIAILIGIAWYTYGGIDHLAQNFVEYRKLSKQSVALGAFTEDMLETRAAALRFRIEHSEESIEAVRKNIAEIQKDKELAEEVFGGDESTLDFLKTLSADLERFQSDFDQATKLQAEHDVKVARLATLGTAMRKDLTEILESVRAENSLDTASNAGIAVQEVMLMRFYMERFLLDNDPKAFERAKAEAGRAMAEADKLIRASLNTEHRRLAVDAKDQLEEFVALMDDIKVVVDKRNESEVAVDHDGEEIQNLYQELLAKVIEQEDVIGDESEASALATETTVAAILGLLIAGITGIWLSSSLKRMANGMRMIAGGDLDVEVEGTAADHELGQMAKALQIFKENAIAIRGMNRQREEIVERIEVVTDTVKTATDEISSGIGDLADRTEHQASSIEETTASIEELAATVRQNSENAQEANQMASAAREAAVGGGEVATRAVSAMGTIEDSSRKITDIVALIQEIAFQTNLLALNASVEAARAGEAGRGFAVVANEVRALAQRAASASKDIKQLIDNSGSQVEEGVKLVNEAGEALGEIVSSVKRVADFVSEIAAASQEQTSGIEQVSNAISSMDEMTQQNASLVEETNAAIRSAHGQVEDLQMAVASFSGDGVKRKAERPRAVESGDSAGNAPNPVHQQQKVIARKVAGGGAAAAVAEEADWEEF